MPRRSVQPSSVAANSFHTTASARMMRAVGRFTLVALPILTFFVYQLPATTELQATSRRLG